MTHKKRELGKFVPRKPKASKKKVVGYGIRVTRHFLGYRKNETEWLREGGGGIEVFPNRAAAKKEILRLESGSYEGGHEESGWPTLRTREIKSGNV